MSGTPSLWSDFFCFVCCIHVLTFWSRILPISNGVHAVLFGKLYSSTCLRADYHIALLRFRFLQPRRTANLLWSLQSGPPVLEDFCCSNGNHCIAPTWQSFKTRPCCRCLCERHACVLQCEQHDKIRHDDCGCFGMLFGFFYSSNSAKRELGYIYIYRHRYVQQRQVQLVEP